MRSLILLILFIVYTVPSGAQTTPQDRIVARVNTSIITSGDVWARYRMIQKTSQLPDTPAIRKEAFPQLLNGLIEEKLQQQLCKRVGITIGEDDVTKAFAELATRNKKKPEEFEAGLRAEKINVDEVKNQLKPQLCWAAFVQRTIRPSVNVTDAEVQKLSDELNALKDRKEIQVAEIVLPSDTSKSTKDSVTLANRLISEMQKGARFSQIASKFSTVASAKDNGLRGWVMLGSGELPTEVEAILTQMPVKALSKPIPTKDGLWLVLKLGERVGQGAPNAEELRTRIGGQKLEKAAQNYLNDVRDEALIEFPQ